MARVRIHDPELLFPATLPRFPFHTAIALSAVVALLTLYVTSG